MIYVEEFEDWLVFINEGGFMLETVERTLAEGYTPILREYVSMSCDG